MPGPPVANAKLTMSASESTVYRIRCLWPVARATNRRRVEHDGEADAFAAVSKSESSPSGWTYGVEATNHVGDGQEAR